MGVTRVRNRLAVTGNVSIGADAAIRRLGAGRLGLEADDYLDLSQGTAQLVINNSTSALNANALGGRNGAIVIRTQGGTPCIGFRLNGTVYYVLRDGNI